MLVTSVIVGEGPARREVERGGKREREGEQAFECVCFDDKSTRALHSTYSTWVDAEGLLLRLVKRQTSFMALAEQVPRL